ncbi:MAG: penicillin-binding protein [Candidatus Nomurabacteria bacterium]|jgi:penicillin-binding protein 1A|nr:penicillin-binding protein [Candidatus Nomurabacteria bacterium]
MSRFKKLSVGSVFKKRSKKSVSALDPNSHKARLMRMKKDRLSHLPKNRFERYKFYLCHPGELLRFWFSAEGRWMFLKILLALICLLAVVVIIFFWLPSSVDARNMDDTIKQRIQTTTNKYLDRNGKLLWEDSGSGQVLKFVEADQISQDLKNATVAIEDHDFYEHGGVSISGIARAVLNNFGGGATQGGSTLTQQLMKQVFFEEEASERGIMGIPRKIKEVFMSIEAERSYSKDQILTYYLNVAPYGGRRNGVQSAAETYFGKDAKKLTLAESALIAGIPQYPSAYNPYNTEYNSSLIERYNQVLDAIEKYMPDKYTAKQIAEARKAFTIENLSDKIQPADALIVGAKAPHFVQMVKEDLEDELGTKVVGQGGLTIKTTLDIRVQKIIDDQIDSLFDSGMPSSMGFDNAAATMVDSQTGQVLGMRGSRDYNYPDFGAVNAATSFIQPGSSIKPEVYASLVDSQRDSKSYGAGSIIADNDNGRSVQQIYGTSVHNANGSTGGSVTMRQGLSNSLNIPAIMAMHFNGGAEPTIEKIRELGDVSYCTDGVDEQVGLAAAIGGCGAKQVEHANAFATFARMGTYKPVTSVLEVKDFQSNVLLKYDPEAGVKQVIDPQSAYIISDILSDANARSGTFGYCSAGFCVPGVKTATKTGTSDTGGQQKDLWMMSYTPKASFSMWWGNHIPKALNYGDGMSLGSYLSEIVGRTHRDVFGPDGDWNNEDWFKQPEGIQSLNVTGRNDLFPSWYVKDNVVTINEPTVFDKISKKLANECTPEAAKETLDVVKTINNTQKTTFYKAPDGYDRDNYDDVHSCDAAAKPSLVGRITATASGSRYEVKATISPGNSKRNKLTAVNFTIDGKTYKGAATGVSNTWSVIVPKPSSDGTNVTVEITDEALFSVSSSPQMVLFD